MSLFDEKGAYRTTSAVKRAPRPTRTGNPQPSSRLPANMTPNRPKGVSAVKHIVGYDEEGKLIVEPKWYKGEQLWTGEFVEEPRGRIYPKVVKAEHLRDVIIKTTRPDPKTGQPWYRLNQLPEEWLVVIVITYHEVAGDRIIADIPPGYLKNPDPQNKFGGYLDLEGKFDALINELEPYLIAFYRDNPNWDYPSLYWQFVPELMRKLYPNAVAPEDIAPPAPMEPEPEPVDEEKEALRAELAALKAQLEKVQAKKPRKRKATKKKEKADGKSGS